ncbi:hypothetical protein MPL3365_50075 [Mesorhizobium plurifarium]|uniref:Uncharacterized protein n=1 Tax=Mesorhizobium plurifarium TaxID=69974 RepID=A0A090GB27_MESPL|nr:hypothetical protein MPL3365_50075 [Mesorhizobium plurifarium]
MIGLATTASTTLDSPRLSGVPFLVESRITAGSGLPEARRSAPMADISRSQSLLSGPPSRMTVPGSCPASVFSAASGGSEIGFSPDFSTIFDTTTRLIDDFPTTSTLEKSAAIVPFRAAGFGCLSEWSSRSAGHIGGEALWFNAGLKPEAQLGEIAAGVKLKRSSSKI